MPARDSNASFVFLVVLIIGLAVAGFGEGRGGSTTSRLSLGSSNDLYEASESWRTSVKIYAVAR
jgi:hypothetical protein